MARSGRKAGALLAVALLSLLRPGASLYSKKDDVETLTAANFEGERARHTRRGPRRTRGVERR